MLLGGLLTLAWFLLRRGRPAGAGVAVGVAVSLKLVPGIVLIVLALRHRRAFGAALLTLAAIGLGVLGLTSVQDHLDYANTSRGVVETYAAYSGNLSLLGSLARGARDLGLPFAAARALWLAGGIASALALVWVTRKPAAPGRRTDVDLEFALAMTLMPLLSPVAWDHYLAFLILPLAVVASRAAESGRRPLGLMALLVLFAVPDAAFHHALAECDAAGLHGLAVWVPLNLRLAGLGGLAVWAGRMLGRREDRPRHSEPESRPSAVYHRERDIRAAGAAVPPPSFPVA